MSYQLSRSQRSASPMPLPDEVLHTRGRGLPRNASRMIQRHLIELGHDIELLGDLDAPASDAALVAEVGSGWRAMRCGELLGRLRDRRRDTGCDKAGDSSLGLSDAQEGAIQPQAASEDASVPQIPVLFLNKDCPPRAVGMIDDAKKVAAAIFERIGMKLIWDPPTRRGLSLCLMDEAKGLDVEKDALGTTPTGSTRCWVYYSRVQHRARDLNASLPDLLGLVFAHEIGHMLNLHGHSRANDDTIMMTGFTPRGWNAWRMGKLSFTAGHVETMRRALASLAASIQAGPAIMTPPRVSPVTGQSTQ